MKKLIKYIKTKKRKDLEKHDYICYQDKFSKKLKDCCYYLIGKCDAYDDLIKYLEKKEEKEKKLKEQKDQEINDFIQELKNKRIERRLKTLNKKKED